MLSVPSSVEDAGLYGALAQRYNTRERREIPIAVQHFEIVTQRAGGNQTVDRRADGAALASRGAVHGDRLQNELGTKRALDERKGQHCLPRHPVSRLTGETLQDLLDHRQTGDNVVEGDHGFEIQRPVPPKHLDPRRRINERHARAGVWSYPGPDA